MQEMRKSPCYQCDEREMFCHMLCARYADYRENMNQARDNRATATAHRAYVNSAARRMANTRGVDMRGVGET